MNYELQLNINVRIGSAVQLIASALSYLLLYVLIKNCHPINVYSTFWFNEHKTSLVSSKSNTKGRQIDTISRDRPFHSFGPQQLVWCFSQTGSRAGSGSLFTLTQTYSILRYTTHTSKSALPYLAGCRDDRINKLIAISISETNHASLRF